MWLDFYVIHIRHSYHLLLFLPCFWLKALPATDFVFLDIPLLRNSFDAVLATLRLVVFGCAIIFHLLLDKNSKKVINL